MAENCVDKAINKHHNNRHHSALGPTAQQEKEKNTATLSKISNAIKGSEKLDVEGTDLLELLSHLEGELQARDVVIAALKSEQLKRVLYGCYAVGSKAAGHGSPLSALQRDKKLISDANKVEEDLSLASASAESQIAALQEVIEKQRTAAARMAACLRESESQRSQLARELEEARAAYERDTAQGDDITYELEKERIRLKQDLEAEVQERQKVEAALKDSNEKLEEEKAKEKQIVLVLLSDRRKLHRLYREEKKRSEDLAQMLHDEKGKMETMAIGLEEESKRSLAMEAELEKHLSQFGCERQQLRDKLLADERRYRDVEDALRKARMDVEHFKKQLAEAHRVAMSQASPPPPYPGNNLVTTGQSVSPTPLSALNRQQPPAASQPYATYSSYSTYGQLGANINSTPPVNSLVGNVGHQGYTNAGAGTIAGSVPRTLPATAVATSRATQGNPVVRSMSGNIGNVAGNQPAPTGNPAHNLKFHQQNYNNTPGGFGHTSHPAMIPAGGNISLLDPDIIPSDIYSQISKPVPGGAGKPGVAAGQSRKPVAGVVGAPTVTEVSAGSRKPGLGKGVPPPVPPNKPVVPVKKEIVGKQRGLDPTSAKEQLGLTLEAGKQSMVTGLQGLKFGISIGGGGGSAGTGADAKLKSDPHSTGVPGAGSGVVGLPAKKFFNNIESKT